MWSREPAEKREGSENLIARKRNSWTTGGKNEGDLGCEAIRRYHNRSIDTTYVIQKLGALAKDVRAPARRGTDLGLSEHEVAFYYEGG